MNTDYTDEHRKQPIIIVFICAIRVICDPKYFPLL